MLVTDSFIFKSGMLVPVENALVAAGFERPLVFSGVVPDPTTDSIAQGLAAWSAAPVGERCDCLVGLGGGSSIDTAKAIALLALAGGKLREHKVPAVVSKALPVVAIPTTAGTGSEATRVAVVTDTESDEKMLLMGLGLLPRAALVDYTLTMSCPYRLTADSALDALCHAMEAFVSRRANPFSDLHALAALRAITHNLRAVCADLSNSAAREALMAAATHAGIAFSNSSVTLIHGMSRPIGAHFHVPHGLSNAMLLPAVTSFSLEGATDRYAQCSRAMNFAQEADGDAEACTALIAGLQDLCKELKVPTPAAYGIGKAKYHELLDTMASQALASGSPNNNPIVPTAEQIKQIYRQVFGA